MQSIGTTELAALETWDSNYFELIIYRMDKSIEDFDKAIELDS